MSGRLSVPFRPPKIVEPMETAVTRPGRRGMRKLIMPLPPEPAADTVKMTEFDMDLPGAAPAPIESRQTTRYSAGEMRNLLRSTRTPLEVWMPRLCAVIASSAILVALAVLGAAWVIAR